MTAVTISIQLNGYLVVCVCSLQKFVEILSHDTNTEYRGTNITVTVLHTPVQIHRDEKDRHHLVTSPDTEQVHPIQHGNDHRCVLLTRVNSEILSIVVVLG